MANPNITIFKKSDQQKVKKFVLKILLDEFGFPSIPAWDADLDNPDKKYKANGGVFFTLKNKEKIIGTVALLPQSKEKIELKRMYIDQKLRKQGLGKKLMDKALKFAKENNYKEIVLDTWTLLTSATKFYNKYGFKEYKRDGEQIFMSLTL